MDIFSLDQDITSDKTLEVKEREKTQQELVRPTHIESVKLIKKVYPEHTDRSSHSINV